MSNIIRTNNGDNKNVIAVSNSNIKVSEKLAESYANSAKKYLQEVSAYISSIQSILNECQTIKNSINMYLASDLENHINNDENPHKVTAEQVDTYTKDALDLLLNSKMDNCELSSVSTSGDYNDLINKPTLFSGSYNDLTNKPTIPDAQIQADWSQTTTTAKDFIKNKPTIPTVPTNVSDFTNDAGYLTSHQDISGKANSADLSTVATTGDYDDLINKPTIPTVNNATLTIQKNGTTVDTFTANASSNKTINITVPTSASDVSALPSSVKYGSSIDLSVNTTTFVVTATLKDQDGTTLSTDTIDLPLESVVVNGSYNSSTKKVVLTLQSGSTVEFSVADLVSGLQSEITSSNKLSADLIADGTTNKTVTQTEKNTWSGKQDSISDLSTIRSGAGAGATAVQPADLATVATSGDYDDLINKPTIPTVPTNISAFTNDTGYLTSHQDISGKANLSDLPTKLSDLTDDLGTSPTHTHSQYLTSHQDISDKANLSDLPTKLSDLTDDLGSSPTHTHSQYLTSHQDISGKANSTDLATVATSGDYDDLINKPTIPTVPTNISAFTNDTGYLTSHQDISGKANLSDLPTKLSDLTDDLGSSPTHTHSQYLTSHQDISGKANSADLATVATSGSYNDLTNKPTVVRHFVQPTLTANGTMGGDDFAVSSSLTDVYKVFGSGSVSLGQNGEFSVKIYNPMPLRLMNIKGSGGSVYSFVDEDYSYIKGSNDNENWTVISFTGSLSSDAGVTLNNTTFYKYYDIILPYQYRSIGAITLTGVEGGALSANSSLAIVATSGDYDDLINKPTLFSGSYNDLTDKPTIPDAQIQADWSQTTTTAKDFIKNKPTIPTVPTNVSDFTNDAGYLTAHQDISGKANTADLSTVATTGDYDDLINKPTIPTVPTIATSVSSSSTNAETVGAKLFYDTVGDIESALSTINSGT